MTVGRMHPKTYIASLWCCCLARLNFSTKSNNISIEHSNSSRSAASLILTGRRRQTW
jgi:hypothetical protein